MKKYLTSAAAIGALFAPSLLFAQPVVVNGASGFSGLAGNILDLLNALVPIAIAVAVVVIVWGAFQIIVGAGDEEARKSGRSKILWGLVGIFLLLAAWALVSIVVNSVTFTGNNAILNKNYF